MPLPWVRLDTSMPDNPSILHLIDSREGRAAAFVWCCSLSYSGKHGTNGFITRSALPRVNGLPIHARLLVEHGFWVPDGSVGWTVDKWESFQMSNEETQARSQRARNAAFKRWGKEKPE